jgi:DNA helicase-2/ATP-dependent DNA helicase PcrA
MKVIPLAVRISSTSVVGSAMRPLSFTKKENKHIAYFVDVLEPAVDAYADRKFGAMFEALGGKVPLVRKSSDKEEWTNSMNRLLQLRDTANVRQLID